MPILGNRGPIAPRELVKGAKSSAPPIARLPGVPSRAASFTPAPAKGVTRAPVSKTELFKGGIPKPFAAAPKLALAYKNAPPERHIGPGLQKLVAESKAAAPKPSGGSGLLATITSPVSLAGSIVSDIPKEVQGKGFITGGGLKKVEEKGYENILGHNGLAGKVARTLGGGISEATTIPAQILPALYLGGKAVVEAKTGKPEALHRMEGSFVKESAIAQAAKGNISGAVSAFKAHPVATGLEASGVYGAANRAAGAVARSGALGADLKAATSLKEPAATAVSRTPQDLLFGAKEPQPALDKRLVTRLRQGKGDPSVMPGSGVWQTLSGRSLGQRLVKHLDQKAGEIRAVQKHNVTEAVHARMTPLRGKPIKGTPAFVPIPGHGAENLFARGLLADPKLIGPKGEPLWREQLRDLIDLHSKPVAGESEYQKASREDLLGHLQSHMDSARLAREGGYKAHAAAVSYARDMKPIESELTRQKVDHAAVGASGKARRPLPVPLARPEPHG